MFNRLMEEDPGCAQCMMAVDGDVMKCIGETGGVCPNKRFMELMDQLGPAEDEGGEAAVMAILDRLSAEHPDCGACMMNAWEIKATDEDAAMMAAMECGGM